MFYRNQAETLKKSLSVKQGSVISDCASSCEVVQVLFCVFRSCCSSAAFTEHVPLCRSASDQREKNKGFMCGKRQQEGKCSWEFLPGVRQTGVLCEK